MWVRIQAISGEAHEEESSPCGCSVCWTNTCLDQGSAHPRACAPREVKQGAGWIVPIVVVGGRITGVWELTDNEVRVSGPRLLRNAGVDAAHVRDHDLQHATDSAILEFP